MNMDNTRSSLLKKLAEAGIRPSVQRLAILEYVFSCKSHPTADEIYTALVKQNPLLSRTTVFSSVKLMAEKGLINSIDISADSTRYDSLHYGPHAHFICRGCGRIFDVPVDTAALTVPEGFVSDNVNVYFKGLCSECCKNKHQQIK